MTTTACLLHSPYTTIPFAQETFSLPTHKTKMAFIILELEDAGHIQGIADAQNECNFWESVG